MQFDGDLGIGIPWVHNPTSDGSPVIAVLDMGRLMGLTTIHLSTGCAVFEKGKGGGRKRERTGKFKKALEIRTLAELIFSPSQDRKAFETLLACGEGGTSSAVTTKTSQVRSAWGLSVDAVHLLSHHHTSRRRYLRGRQTTEVAKLADEQA
ncbi:hypothetical protein An08g07180 [Aspergillus niger]|uniref:Uncharacterized protein n=2 Tax=Aspergillus niger TaxID=5061 RepID=A2QRT7_ASPNC|nr:hypothetical protein An08g07180 [Aspergillus niger]CAK39965.1 hypothetical protein An08g07180 [Aspergillus niger]